MDVRPALDPTTLAELLDRWAFRREKVLALLDVRAAAKARELARACQEFAVWQERSDVSDLEAQFVWLELRARVARLLTEAHASVSTPSTFEGDALRRSPSGIRPLAGVRDPAPLRAKGRFGR